MEMLARVWIRFKTKRGSDSPIPSSIFFWLTLFFDSILARSSAANLAIQRMRAMLRPIGRRPAQPPRADFENEE